VTKSLGNVLDLPLEQRAELALKAAVQKVILEHARQGLPIYVWRDGAVVEIPPDELRAKVRAEREA
jgi:hypothetical protein